MERQFTNTIRVNFREADQMLRQQKFVLIARDGEWHQAKRIEPDTYQVGGAGWWRVTWADGAERRLPETAPVLILVLDPPSKPKRHEPVCQP